MSERINILVNALPRYGEILLGIGSLIQEWQEELLENHVARDSIKEYLLTKSKNKLTLKDVVEDIEFQKIMYKYTGKRITVGILKGEITDNHIINLKLLGLFNKSIWPIIVKHYIDEIEIGKKMVVVPIKILKKVYVNMYEEETSDNFFKELKNLLLYNYIIISEAIIAQNGDILLKLMLPVPPHMNYNQSDFL